MAAKPVSEAWTVGAVAQPAAAHDIIKFLQDHGSDSFFAEHAIVR